MLAADEKKTEPYLVAVKNHAIDISDFFPSYSTVYVKVFLAPVKTTWNNETGTWLGLKKVPKQSSVRQGKGQVVTFFLSSGQTLLSSKIILLMLYGIVEYIFFSHLEFAVGRGEESGNPGE